MIQLSDFQSALIWNLAVILAALLAIFVQWKEGRRRGMDSRLLLSVLAALNMAFLLGMRLGAFSTADWSLLFQQGIWPNQGAKTVLGGIFLALPLYFILKKWWRLPDGMGDVLVLGLPIAAGFSRIGCFFAGCCYGVPDKTIGVCYGSGSPAYQAQLNEGLIASGAAHSSPVFPVQLLLFLLSMMVFAYLWQIRKRTLVPGNLALKGFLLMAFSRFIVEFFRDSASNPGFSGIFLGPLKTAQWAALLFMLILGVLLMRQKRQTPDQKAKTRQAFASASPIFVLFALALLAYGCSPILSLDEKAILLLSGIPALILSGLYLREQWKQQQHPVTASLLFSATGILLFLNPLDSLPKLETKYPIRSVEFGVGGTGGHYTEVHRGCSGSIVSTDDIQNRSGAFEAKYKHQASEYSSFEAGLKGIKGRTIEDNSATVADITTNYNGLSAFASGNSRFIGAEFGVINIAEKNNDINIGSTGVSRRWVPSGKLRFGPMYKYSFDLSIFRGPAFNYYPEPVASVGFFNWGFNDKNGNSNLRFGLSVIRGESAFDAAFRAPLIKDVLSVSGALFFQKRPMFSLGVHYNMGLKE